MLVISEKLQFNSIIWIRSLPEAELGPSRRIVEDLEGLSRHNEIAFSEKVVGSRRELITVLSELSVAAEKGLRPILHFDAHGDRDLGLLLSPSEEFVEWSDLANTIRTINVNTLNNLICVFASCYAYYFNFHVELKEATPSYLVMAPTDEIGIGFLEQQTLAFYRAIFETDNVTGAFDDTLAKSMTLYHCQGVFVEALARYLIENCQGKAKRERLERMVSEHMKQNQITNPTSAQLREIRGKLKLLLEPTQVIINYFAPKFLIGRDPQFTVNDLKRLVGK